MDNKSKTILVVAIIAIAVAIGAVLFMMSKLKQKDIEMEEMVEILSSDVTRTFVHLWISNTKRNTKLNQARTA